MSTPHPYWARQACEGRAFSILFSLNPCVGGFIFTVVSKTSGYMSAQHRCKPLVYDPHLEVRQAGLGAVFVCWGVELGLGDANKKGFPSCKPFTSDGTQACAWLPLPICADISNVNMNPVNFHTLVTASPVSVEASENPSPSWSCWESLDLWQLRLFLGCTLGCQMWDSGFISASRREMSQAGGRFSLINPYCHLNLSATATENREPNW